MMRRVVVRSEVKGLRPGAVAKASLNGANELRAADPKRDDLALARMKRP